MGDSAGSIEVEVVWEDDAAVVRVAGDVDVATAQQLGAPLREICNGAPSKLTIDLSDVPFMDSSGLAVLLRARRALPASCPVVIRTPHPRVRKLLEITALDRSLVVEG